MTGLWPCQPCVEEMKLALVHKGFEVVEEAGLGTQGLQGYRSSWPYARHRGAGLTQGLRIIIEAGFVFVLGLRVLTHSGGFLSIWP